jgi:alpha-1,6-mannosyltransferase
VLLHAYARWLRGERLHSAGQAAAGRRALRACAALVGAAALVFRCDALVLAAPLGLSWLARRRVGFVEAAAAGAAGGAAALAATALVDSALWRFWVWPEGAVLLFNTVQNRSAEWGVLPWHW